MGKLYPGGGGYDPGRGSIKVLSAGRCCCWPASGLRSGEEVSPSRLLKEGNRLPLVGDVVVISVFLLLLLLLSLLSVMLLQLS